MLLRHPAFVITFWRWEIRKDPWEMYILIVTLYVGASSEWEDSHQVDFFYVSILWIIWQTKREATAKLFLSNVSVFFILKTKL